MTYQCTVCDDDRYPGATTWTGSLFDCGNGITLRHSRFESGTVGECNNGEVIARSIEVMDTVKGSRCYVSQLNFIASRDHNNETIMCEYVSSMDVTVVDEIIILFETGIWNFETLREKIIIIIIFYTCSDPIPPPSNIHISEISPLVLKLSWNQSSFFCQYIITSMAIGSNSVCSNTTKFFIDTTYFMLYTNVFTIGHNCSFSVETVVCGNITGGKSVPLLVTFKGTMICIFVTLKVIVVFLYLHIVPDPPLFAPSSNYYSPKDKLIYTGFYISVNTKT